MKTEEYKQMLLKKQRELSAQIDREHEDARGQVDEPGGDLGDASVSDEEKDVQFTAADSDRTVLNQVRDALQRIEDGTYGKCSVDGEPIEEKRLKEVPWAAYCLKHQQEIETAERVSTPTL